MKAKSIKFLPMKNNRPDIFKRFTIQKLTTELALTVAYKSGIILQLSNLKNFTNDDFIEAIMHTDIKIELQEVRRALLVLLDLMVECNLLNKKKMNDTTLMGCF